MSHDNFIDSETEALLSCFPYGVGHSTEGMCLLLRMGKHRILLECGLKNIQPLKAQSQPPADLVICSHAHSDHAQGLLALHQAFPNLPIYASEVTAKLISLNWLQHPLDKVPQFCQPLPWREPLKIADDLIIELFPAGHLPGAAAILLSYKTPKKIYKVLYTGDFCLSNFQLVEGLTLENVRNLAPDVLIIEGSYGTARHPHRRQQEKYLMQRISQALAESQNILLPVPPLGLGQEILKLLRSHHQFTGKDVDIWVTGKIAYACDLYLRMLSNFPLAVQNFARHQSLFWDDRIYPRMGRFTSKKLIQQESSPFILLVDHTDDLSKYCWSESGSWLILIPEYPRTLIDQDSSEFLALQNLPNVTVESYLLAEHSDGRNTTQLIHNIRPQHIIFVHGLPAYLADLTSLEELQNRYQLHSPRINILVELPIGEQFMQPAPPTKNYYEGEVNEIGAVVGITLPDQINQDPRWAKFADTGLIEARWQGEELILRGLSQKELLNQNHELKKRSDVDSCNICRHYRSQKCWNQNSPLFGFKVTPEGYCPVFESLEDEA